MTNGLRSMLRSGVEIVALEIPLQPQVYRLHPLQLRPAATPVDRAMPGVVNAAVLQQRRRHRQAVQISATTSPRFRRLVSLAALARD